MRIGKGFHSVEEFNTYEALEKERQELTLARYRKQPVDGRHLLMFFLAVCGFCGLLITLALVNLFAFYTTLGVLTLAMMLLWLWRVPFDEADR